MRSYPLWKEKASSHPYLILNRQVLLYGLKNTMEDIACELISKPSCRFGFKATVIILLFGISKKIASNSTQLQNVMRVVCCLLLRCAFSPMSEINWLFRFNKFEKHSQPGSNGDKLCMTEDGLQLHLRKTLTRGTPSWRKSFVEELLRGGSP